MNIGAIAAKATTLGGPKVQLAAAKVAKYSPQILTAVGIVGGVASTVLIARATLKVEAIVDNHEMGREVIAQRTQNGFYDSDNERTKDVTYLFVRTGLDFAKIYGPGVSLGVASIVSIIAAQGIQQKRQVALVAAVKSAESAFQAYRARVVAAIGEEKEAEIRYGISTETIEDESGKKIKVRKFDPSGLSDYVRYFDETNRNWQRGNRELNLLFLKNIQNWANDRLNARGYVYLNEVYGWLGFPEVPAGQVVGWMHKDFDNGDGYIDFGWDNPVNEQKKKFLDGDDGGILLDFNVDGEINSKL